MLFADRTSCHGFEANRFRLFLSSCAYVLMETMRRTALAGTEMAKAQCHSDENIQSCGGGHGVGAADCVFAVECLSVA